MAELVVGNMIANNSSGSSDSINNGRRRASIASHPIGDRSRRNSIEKSDSANSVKNTIPNYLRASTGSCHDSCKYGTEHTFEEKPWKKKPLRKSIANSSSNDQNFISVFVSGEKKNEKIVSSVDTNKHSPDLKLPSDAKSRLTKTKTSFDAKKSGNKASFPNLKPLDTKKYLPQDPPEIIKREIISSIDSLTNSKTPTCEKTIDHHPLDSQPVKAKPLSTSGNLDGTRGKGELKRDVKKGRKIVASRAFAKKVPEPSAATLSLKLSPSKTKFIKAEKPVNALKDRNMVHRAETKTTENEKVPEKILHVIETGNGKSLVEPKKSLSHANTPFLSSEENGSEAEEFVSDNGSVEIGNVQPVNGTVQPVKENQKILRKSTVVVNKVKDHAPVKLKFRSGKIMDLHSDTNTPRRLRFRKARTLMSEEGKGDSRKILKKTDAQKVSLKHQEGEENTDAQGLFNNVREKTVISDGKYRSPPVKLKFRSGKVVDIHSDNNTPKRLRFRRARVLEVEDVTSCTRRRNFEKAEGNDDATGSGSSSKKVALKHQIAAHGKKKDGQGLLNNVIEETASKLVESRKSKVKALVGAFETVISLQEKKPSSHAAAATN